MKERPVILLTSPSGENKEFGTALKKRGYKVLNARTLKGIRQGLKKGVDLVLIDSNGKKDWGEIEICRTIRSEEKYQNLPIVLMIGEKDFTEKGGEILNHADEILIRPVDMRVFQSVINHFLQKRALVSLSARTSSQGERGVLPGACDEASPASPHSSASPKENSCGLKLWDLLIDPLTGLFNKSYLGLRLEEEFKRSKRYRFPLSFAIILANFVEQEKEYSDVAPFDLAVKEIAGILLSESRDVDIVARTGLQEFSLLLPNTGCGEVIRIVKRLSDRIICQFDGEERKEFLLLLRAGTSSYPNRLVEDERGMVEMASEALEKAIHFGRDNRICIWESMIVDERE